MTMRMAAAAAIQPKKRIGFAWKAWSLFRSSTETRSWRRWTSRSSRHEGQAARWATTSDDKGPSAQVDTDSAWGHGSLASDRPADPKSFFHSLSSICLVMPRSRRFRATLPNFSRCVLVHPLPEFVQGAGLLLADRLLRDA